MFTATHRAAEDAHHEVMETHFEARRIGHQVATEVHPGAMETQPLAI